jgi:hypothetical protein
MPPHCLVTKLRFETPPALVLLHLLPDKIDHMHSIISIAVIGAAVNAAVAAAVSAAAAAAAAACFQSFIH